MAIQDPYLHEWDERFHALVSRNMLENPFAPTLMKYPIIHYHPSHWGVSHIWLHKQPLFMWQMALSMKIFGVSVFASRYPSVLMGALMVPLLYSIAKMLTNNNSIAWVSALIFCFCGFQLEQISGTMGMDHNDVAFSFYILASIWAYSKYTNSPRFMFIAMIGIFAGCAVLTKWLTGLVVFSGWGVNVLLHFKSGKTKREIRDLLSAFIIAVLVFLPWQLYIHYAYPLESKIESELNTRHIYEAVEGHSGTIFFYLDHFTKYFGEVGWVLVPAGFVIVLLQLRKQRLGNTKQGISLIAIFTAIFVFFSYIAMTKIIGYFFIAVPVGCIFISIACFELGRQLQLKKLFIPQKIIYPSLIAAIVVSILNPEKFGVIHDPNDNNRKHKINNIAIYKKLKNIIPSNVKIVLNANKSEEFLAMFYNNDLRVFSEMVDNTILDSLLNNHVPIAVFESRPSYELPVSLTNNRSVFIIHEKLEETKYLD